VRGLGRRGEEQEELDMGRVLEGKVDWREVDWGKVDWGRALGARMALALYFHW